MRVDRRKLGFHEHANDGDQMIMKNPTMTVCFCKKPCISEKEPYICAKEPCISAKEIT